MKKYLCFVFVIFLISLLILSEDRVFKNVVTCADIKYDILDSNHIKISHDDVEKFLKKMDVEIVSKFEVSDRLIIEGYTTIIADYIVIDNCKINIQISITDDAVIVGSPLINGSF